MTGYMGSHPIIPPNEIYAAIELVWDRQAPQCTECNKFLQLYGKSVDGVIIVEGHCGNGHPVLSWIVKDGVIY